MSSEVNILVTQRADYIADVGENRISLDIEWFNFLLKCGFTVFPAAPTVLGVVQQLESLDLDGIVLTGGESLVSCGGSNSERDEMEAMLLDYSANQKLPLLGVCRGMQHILQSLGVPLVKVEGHVVASQTVGSRWGDLQVNSYHNFGATTKSVLERSILEMLAWSDDGIVKAVRHRTLPWTGCMWHPERRNPFCPMDVKLFREVFCA